MKMSRLNIYTIIILTLEVFRDQIYKFKTDNIHYHKSLKNRMLNEIFNEVIPVVLAQEDLNSMYYSIENRSPF